MTWLSVIENDDLDEFLALLKQTPVGLDLTVSQNVYNRTIGGLLFDPSSNLYPRIHGCLCSSTDLNLHEQVLYYINQYFNLLLDTNFDGHIDKSLLYYLLGLTLTDCPLYESIFVRCCRQPNPIVMQECLRYYPSWVDPKTSMVVKFDANLSQQFWNSFLPEFIPAVLSVHRSMRTERMIYQLSTCLDYGCKLDVSLSVYLKNPLPKMRFGVDRGITLVSKPVNEHPQNAFDILYRVALYVKQHSLRPDINYRVFIHNICKYVDFAPKDCYQSRYVDIDNRHWDIWIANYNLIKHWQDTQVVSRADDVLYHYLVAKKLINSGFFGLLRMYFQCLQSVPFLLQRLLSRYSSFPDGSLIFHAYQVTSNYNQSSGLYRCLLDAGANFDERVPKVFGIYQTIFNRLYDSNPQHESYYDSTSYSYRTGISCLIIDWLSKQRDSYFHILIADLRRYLKYFL
jgi:hypothetical protein